MGIQTTGHLLIDGQKILILVREKRYSRQLKIRLSGKDGNRFNDEEYYLQDNPSLLQDLLVGKVVEC